MTTRGSYVHKSMLKFSGGGGGHPKNIYIMVSDKTIHRAFRTRATLETKPIRKMFNFHYLPKLYIGFNVNIRF